MKNKHYININSPDLELKRLSFIELNSDSVPKNLCGAYIWDNGFQITKRDLSNVIRKSMLVVDFNNDKIVIGWPRNYSEDPKVNLEVYGDIMYTGNLVKI